MASTNGKAPTGVRAVERAADLLLAFSADRPVMSLAEIAKRTGIPKPTAYRLLTTLVDRGLIAQHDDRRYGLGVRLVELGALVQDQLALVRVTRDIADWLVAETGETVLVGEADWERGELVIVAKREGTHPVSVLSPLGRRSRMGPGCLGRAVLAALDDEVRNEWIAKLAREDPSSAFAEDPAEWNARLSAVRAQGYATEQGAFLPGVSGVASPIYLLGDKPAGAIAVVGPASRLDAGRLAELGPLVQKAASEVSFTRLTTEGAR